jgi:hydrogenase/urease accessory protein HupE
MRTGVRAAIGLAIGLAIVLHAERSVSAHPAPWSYVDLRIDGSRFEAAIVVHDYDVAHELGIEPVERLLDPAFAAAEGGAMAALLAPRFALFVDGRPLTAIWSAPEVLVDRQSLRFRLSYPDVAAPGLVTLSVDAFPYDPQHITYVNVYEQDALAAQEIVNGRGQVEFFTGTRQGTVAVARRFVPSGVHHILIGPDHILFLVGLLLTGGSLRRLVLVVTSFTLAHSVTLSLAALDLVNVPAWIVEPAIALSIVYVGVDNLLRGSGRDVRAWIALAFGLIHGFGFANVLRELGLPRSALGWSLASFNLGVEIGQLAIVLVVGVILTAIRSRSERGAGLIARSGSWLVILAGAYWFIERTFVR